MLPAREISKKNMAVERLNHSLNDSLEIGRSRVNGGSQFSPSRSTPPVAPVEMGEKADFRAFSAQEDELPGGSLCPDLLRYDDLLLLQDKTNGKNRALGVERLQAAVESVENSTVLEDNLPSLVDEACSAMGDSHIKVCLAGLQLLDPLIRRTGSNLSPHISSLVEAVLVKMGRNKHVLKKAGMRILVHLMHYSQPQDVLAESCSGEMKPTFARCRHVVRYRSRATRQGHADYTCLQIHNYKLTQCSFLPSIFLCSVMRCLSMHSSVIRKRRNCC